MGGDTLDWQATYEDPLRWRFPDTAGSRDVCQVSGEPKVEVCENENCTAKVVFMHRPTHAPALERSGQYPYSQHLAGKKRLWELRLQLRFKSPPQGQTYFGVELGRFVPVTGLARGAQKALVSACQGIVGDCYHTVGDDPATASGELEPPTFVMPLWAFDQFQVSRPGEEPDIRGDMEGVGFRRSGDVKGYIKAMKAAVAGFSADKVYTFCFWGVSKFLDVLRWRVKMGAGLAGKLTDGMDFNKLCGSPPVYLTMYELPVQAADARHLASRKRRFFHAEVWSTVSPPRAQAQAEVVPAQQEEAEELTVFDYWSGTAGLDHMLPGADPVPAAMQFDDLLGLESSAQEPLKPLQQAETRSTSPGASSDAVASSSSAAERPPPDSVDLLGLF